MDRQTLRDWVHRFNRLGPEGLHDIQAPGARPRLGVAQKAEFDCLSGDDVGDNSFHHLDFAQTQGACPPAVSRVTRLCSVSVQLAAERFTLSPA